MTRRTSARLQERVGRHPLRRSDDENDWVTAAPNVEDREAPDGTQIHGLTSLEGHPALDAAPSNFPLERVEQYDWG
jgi:hypothetical protein